jgi:hypothetical protein
MSESDLWDNAVVCAMAAYASSDPKMRAILTCLGEFWLDLARMHPLQFDDPMALHIEAVQQMQAELIGVTPTFH